jgi:hypothetical protein
LRIAIIVEGKTEKAFKPVLLDFLKTRLSGKMPKLDIVPYDGRIPSANKLKRVVERLLNDRKSPADAVIALTDVYTGSQPPEFQTAAEAKDKMQEWVGAEDRFFPHVALHDFEAWLLPYWEKIKALTGSNRAAPAANSETVNHHNPPAHRLAEMYRTGSKSKSYIKPRDAGRILKGENLLVAINACSELKAFVNRILELCGLAEEDRIS